MGIKTQCILQNQNQREKIYQIYQTLEFDSKKYQTHVELEKKTHNHSNSIRTKFQFKLISYNNQKKKKKKKSSVL